MIRTEIPPPSLSVPQPAVHHSLLWRVGGRLPRPVRQIVKSLMQPAHVMEIQRRDLRARLGFYRYPHRVLFVAGIPKSATTFVENFLFQVPGYCPRELFGDRRIIEANDLPDHAFARAPADRYSYFKTHVNPTDRNLAILHRAGIRKIIVMYRDPRDIVVSRYFHQAWNLDPRLPGDQLRYDLLTEEEGIAASIEVVLSNYLPWMAGWRARVSADPDSYHVMTYEQLITGSTAAFRDLLRFYDIDVGDGQLQSMVARARAVGGGRAKLTGMAGTKSTFRRGAIGDWKQHFRDAHRARFKAGGGAQLIEWGYEQDSSW